MGRVLIKDTFLICHKLFREVLGLCFLDEDLVTEIKARNEDTSSIFDLTVSYPFIVIKRSLEIVHVGALYLVSS
jgi:hypothetical protein